MFNLIQKTVSNYISAFDEQLLVALLHLLKQFSGLTESKNFQYGLIEYFYPISDHISKQCLNDEAVWTELFEFLNLNIEVSDPEIRNTSLNIFAGIINNYGGHFSAGLWTRVFGEIYLGTFDRIFEVYFNLLREESPVRSLPDTPDFVLSLKDQFDSKRRSQKPPTPGRPQQMLAAPEFDSAATQWQETVRTLIQSFNRIVTKYLAFEPKVPSVTELVYQKSFYLFRITNKTIFTEVSLTLKALLTAPVLIGRQKQTLLEEMEAWLKKNKNQGQAVHEMMHILGAVLEDTQFVTEREHFQLILRIYVEILYFSAFSDEYSTYFYNLEILTKVFLKNLLAFLTNGTEASKMVFPLFAAALPELFVTKLINKKANETAVSFLGTFFDEIGALLESLSSAQLKQLLEKLFPVVSLRSVSNYIAFVEAEKEAIYVVFYDRLATLVERLKEVKKSSHLLVILELFAQRSLLANEIFQLRSVKFRERVIEREAQIGSTLSLYVIDAAHDCRKIPGFDFENSLSFVDSFKFNFMKVEGLFGLHLEDQKDPDECFLTLLYKRLEERLKDATDIALQLQVLLFLKREFTKASGTFRSHQLVDKQ